jgi:hypothetical protein
MADEISITAKLSVSKSGVSETNATSTFSHTMTGNQICHINPDITTTAGVVSLSPVDTTARYHLFVRNLDVTNEVLLSFDGGTTWPFVVLPGKSFGPVTVTASRTFWADAQVATCVVEFVSAEI